MKALLLALLLAACTTTPNSPQQVVFAAKTQYAAALTVAVAYKRLPSCVTAPQPCSSAPVVAQLQKASDVAAAALDSAESAVRTPGFGSDVGTSAITAANAALAALLSITATLGVH